MNNSRVSVDSAVNNKFLNRNVGNNTGYNYSFKSSDNNKCKLSVEYLNSKSTNHTNVGSNYEKNFNKEFELCRDNSPISLHDMSNDDSEETSGDEQFDITDFFVKENYSKIENEPTIIDLSDDNSLHGLENNNKDSSNSYSKKDHKVQDGFSINSSVNQIQPKKRGRPPKCLNNLSKVSSNRIKKNEKKNLVACSPHGRTKLSYKNVLPNLMTNGKSSSLNCAIKFGEPIGVLKKKLKEKNVSQSKPENSSNSSQVCNRPRRLATQQQQVNTEDEESGMSWQEERDIRKALTASLKTESDIMLSNKLSMAQRKFVIPEDGKIKVKGKRGRKSKEYCKMVAGEKAHTEDFISFLCIRSAKTNQSNIPHIPTFKDLFLNCIKESKFCTTRCSEENGMKGDFCKKFVEAGSEADVFSHKSRNKASTVTSLNSSYCTQANSSGIRDGKLSSKLVHLPLSLLTTHCQQNKTLSGQDLASQHHLQVNYTDS